MDWKSFLNKTKKDFLSLSKETVSYTHLRAHETLRYLVCRLLLEKKMGSNENQIG